MDENNNDSDERPDANPAPALSAEFLSGGTAAGLEKIRARLLDLTNRNRLLNFRHSSASSLRIVDADLNVVFARLLNEEAVPLRAVPEPPLPPLQSGSDSPDEEMAKPIAADHAESLGWKTSYDLTTPSRHNADSRFLPALHYVEDLETLTRKIGSAAKTVIEESGTNMLYLTLGFLEWYESDDSHQAHIAPLLTTVALNRAATKGKGFEATLEYSGEDFATNLSLVEKMRRDFAVEIPSIEEEDTPETYFARFEPILSQKQRFKIRRHITLSLLSFGKLLMYRDLDSKVWPGIAKHQLVTELFEGRKNDTITHAEEHPIDAPELQHELPPLVVDADSSQHSLQAFDKAPLGVLHLRSPQLESEGVDRIVGAAAARARTLRDQHGRLDDTFNLSTVFETTDAPRLRAHASAIEDANVWHRWFGRDYRTARKTFKRFARDTRKASRQQMTQDFRSLAEHHQARTEFDSDKQCRELLGALFKGVETKWDDLQLLVSWYQDVFTLLPEVDENSVAFRDLLLKSRTERVKTVNAGLAAHPKNRAAVEQLRTTISTLPTAPGANGPATRPIAELQTRLKAANSHLEEGIAALLMADLRTEVTVRSVAGLLKAANSHRAGLAHIESQEQIRNLLGDLYQGIDSDFGRVTAVVRFADSVVNKTIPTATAEWLLSEEYFSRLGQLRQWLSQTVRACDEISQIRSDIRTLAASNDWHTDENEPLESLVQKAERALEQREELAQWLHFLRARAESRQAGLVKLTSLADGARIEPLHLLPAFRFIFHNTLARSLFAEHPDLFGFSGVTHEQIREQFAKADKQVIRLYRERVAAIVDRRQAPYGNQSGPVKTWTELALITHEIGKQKRHLPIRQLVRRAATALQGMKPCFMMGPLSVAQYLAPGRLRFDLVVMDEASQLKPEEAIGAIARAGQMVNQYQRFGPINGPNGHRRLNVLFTRAKKRVEVFSSLDPDRIQTTSSSAWGLRALKQYLTFARSGVLETADDGGPQPTNDFERSVGAVLKEKGFDVIPQVGVAGFFVDLAVRHPTKPGTYLLGIECDGASYHSGRSARDRDRLRQEILENQGWRIHRVWSTDWFKSRNTEIKRLLKKIDDLLNSDPDYRKEVERAHKVTSLRQQLIDLRENEIKPSFPDSPPESGLLRQLLLDEFVRRRPRTKEDWFKLISYDLRSQTDSKQVGQYLGRVLDIIASSYE